MFLQVADPATLLASNVYSVMQKFNIYSLILFPKMYFFSEIFSVQISHIPFQRGSFFI